MSYYHSLAFQLRLRHLPEGEVARVLQDVRELSVASGTSPDVEFGPAEQYAASFPAGRQRFDLPLCVFLACLLAALVLGVGNVAADLRGAARLLPPGPSLLASAALLVGGATTAIVLLHRLPRAFRRQDRGQAGMRRPDAEELPG